MIHSLDDHYGACDCSEMKKNVCGRLGEGDSFSGRSLRRLC